MLSYLNYVALDIYLSTLVASISLGLLLFSRFYSYIRERNEIIRRFKESKIPFIEQPQLFTGHFRVLLDPHNYELVTEYHEKLGDTYGALYGPDPWVLTIDLELIQRIWLTEGSIHVDKTQYRLPFMSELNESLAQLRGDRWRAIRRIMGPSFTPKSMKSDNVFRDINTVCDLFVKSIERAGKVRDEKSQHDAIKMDVVYEFKRFAVETIFRVAFGIEHNEQFVLNSNDPMLDSLHEGSHLISSPLVKLSVAIGFARRLFGFFVHLTPLGPIIRYIHSILTKSIIKRQKLLIQNNLGRSNRTMIDSLIERFRFGKMHDESLKANLFFILLAGYETSANTMAMMFWFLAREPAIQEKLRKSLASEGEKAEYLNWVIWETLRLYPPVPGGIGRVLEHDIVHKGRRIYKGTTVNASIYTLHRWPAYWGKDADFFRPERFGEPTDLSPLRFFAFGEGPRICIGKHLAMAEIKAITSRLLLKYRLSFCSETPERIDVISPNMIHFIIEHPIKLSFTEITNLQ